MKKKKVSHNSMKFCPKNGSPACCVLRQEQPNSDNPFDGIDCAVRDAWLTISELEPSIKDIKKFFAQKLIISYLFQCTRIGLTEREMKVLFDKECKRHYEGIKAFRKIAKKI